jgi:hypothetical protein
MFSVAARTRARGSRSTRVGFMHSLAAETMELITGTFRRIQFLACVLSSSNTVQANVQARCGSFAVRGGFVLRAAALLTMVSTIAFTAVGRTAGSTHKITLRFDYDFRSTPACSAKVSEDCVQQFVVYDISGGAAKRIKLLVIPVPANARGLVHGIAATTPPLLFEPGKHLLAVSAKMPNGRESDPSACTTWVKVP